MAPFLAHTEHAQTDHAPCWQPLLEVPGGEFLDWSSTTAVEVAQASAFGCAWREDPLATPYKPRGRFWEQENIHGLSMPSAEKDSLGNHAIASRGSAMHGSGGCKPCAWYWKSVGCSKGQDCIYCHLCLEGELKMRRKAKMAALRSGQTASTTQDGCMEKDTEAEVRSEPCGAEASSAQPILPIQLESLLPEANTHVQMAGESVLPSDMMVPMACGSPHGVSSESPSDFALASGSAASCVFPSMPPSAPPCNPPLIHSFDANSFPAPSQAFAACDQWQPWSPPSTLPWIDTDCSQWMSYPQDLSFDTAGNGWPTEEIESVLPAPPLAPPGLRRAPPEVLGDGMTMWRLLSSPQSANPSVLIVTRRCMFSAYEVLSEDWDQCPSSPRARSCPPEMHYSVIDAVVEAEASSQAPECIAPRVDAVSSCSKPAGDVSAKPPLEAASPARGGARQARARAGQPVRMVWRKVDKSEGEQSPASTCSSDGGELLRSPVSQSQELSPISRGRPRIGRAGPRGPASWEPCSGGKDKSRLWLAKRCEGGG
jgi:hypothetical protein